MSEQQHHIPAAEQLTRREKMQDLLRELRHGLARDTEAFTGIANNDQLIARGIEELEVHVNNSNPPEQQ